MNETITVDGSDVVVRHLPGRSPALVLVHGAGGNHMSWDEILPVLSGREVVVPCLPGRCGSGGKPLASVEAIEAWLRSVLRKIALREMVLVGHSLGGAVAIEYARRDAGGAPGPTLRGLGLVATGAKLRVMQEILDLVDEHAASGIPVNLTRYTFLERTSDELVDHVQRHDDQTPPTASAVDWRAAHAFDRLEQLGTIRVPTLVVGGESDPLTPPKYQQYLIEHIEGAKLELVPAAGHMLHIEQPNEVARAIRAFVDGLAV